MGDEALQTFTLRAICVYQATKITSQKTKQGLASLVKHGRNQGIWLRGLYLAMQLCTYSEILRYVHRVVATCLSAMCSLVFVARGPGERDLGRELILAYYLETRMCTGGTKLTRETSARSNKVPFLAHRVGDR